MRKNYFEFTFNGKYKARFSDGKLRLYDNGRLIEEYPEKEITCRDVIEAIKKYERAQTRKTVGG